MYYVNPSAYTGITVVPSAIINRCLKLTSAVQLKVILAVCEKASEGFDAAVISAMTGIKESEVEDCLIYWQEEGIITAPDTVSPAGNRITEQAEKKNTQSDASVTEKKENPTEVRQEILETRPERLTREQIAARLTESKELRQLMDELQKRLGRLIGQNDQSAFILLHDYYGLTPEIIAMICEYARLHNKANNINYIVTVGKDWSRREIDTVAAATAEISRLEAAGELWAEFLKITGNAFAAKPSDKQRDTVDRWINSWHITDEIIGLAFEEMKNNGVKPNLAYMDKIIANWYGAGATTPEKVKKYQNDFEDKKLAAAGTKKRPVPKTSADGNESASYDIDKAVEKATTTVPKVRKREKR